MENPNQLKCNECYRSVDDKNEASFLVKKLYLIAFIRLNIKELLYDCVDTPTFGFAGTA